MVMSPKGFVKECIVPDGMTIRENVEKREMNVMPPFGCQSAHSQGRETA